MWQFVLIMVLWWSAASISQCLSVDESGQYGPGMHLFLVVVYFPAAVGTWLLPLYEIILGTTPWWGVLLGVLTGRWFAIQTPRFLFFHPIMLFAGHLIGIVASLSGCVISLIHIL